MNVKSVKYTAKLLQKDLNLNNYSQLGHRLQSLHKYLAEHNENSMALGSVEKMEKLVSERAESKDKQGIDNSIQSEIGALFMFA